MNKYSWHGIDLNGNNKKGESFALNSSDLQLLLIKQGIALLNFKKKKANVLFATYFKFSKKISLEQKLLFLEQFAVLVESSVPIVKALKILQKQFKSKKIKNIILLIIYDIEKGESFSDCLKQFPNIFSLSDIYLIKSGEHSGRLGLVLKGLTENLQQKLEFKKQLKQAALLPFITLLFSLLIICGIFIFVIPQFEMLFNSFDKELPSSTQFLIKISNFLRSDYGIYFLLGFLCFLYFIKIIQSSNLFIKLKDRIVLKIYFFYKVFLFSDLIIYLKTLSIFLNFGIDLKKALEFSQETVKNYLLKEKIKKVTNFVIQGLSLSESFEKCGTYYFPDNLIAFTNIGEQSGNLPKMLNKISNILERELKSRLKIFTTIFQPLLLIVLGLLIAFLMLSIYLPIFNMASVI